VFFEGPTFHRHVAHYAQDAKGICLGFDEDALANTFSTAYIDDVSYSEKPAQIESYLVEFAHGTGKRRHTLRMMAIANRAAYFMKRLDWKYERERRLVVDEDAVQECDGILIARVPQTTLRYIILGQNIEERLRHACETHAAAANATLLRFCIGKRSYEPFFSTGNRYLRWNGSNFDLLSGICTNCGCSEAVSTEGICRWCRISEETRRTAAARSMLSATLYYGIDEGIPMEFDGLEPRGYLARSTREEARPISDEATSAEPQF
jgi:Protein of unknown function (DUF2971)